MNDTNNRNNILAENLTTLRSANGYSLEKVAEAIGVTRQAVSKWEAGDSAPDIANCAALAELYNVSLDNLVQFDQQREGVAGLPPKGKHLFGTVQIGERGQIVIPKKARDTLALKHGDTLLVLGDTNPGTAGIALVPADEVFLKVMGGALDHYTEKEPDNETEET